MTLWESFTCLIEGHQWEFRFAAWDQGDKMLVCLHCKTVRYDP